MKTALGVELGDAEVALLEFVARYAAPGNPVRVQSVADVLGVRWDQAMAMIRRLVSMRMLDGDLIASLSSCGARRNGERLVGVMSRMDPEELDRVDLESDLPDAPSEAEIRRRCELVRMTWSDDRLMAPRTPRVASLRTRGSR